MPIAADLSRVMKNLRVRLPGALDNVIQLELFSAVDEFLKDSGAWKETITFRVTADETNYTLTPIMGTILRLDGVRNSNDTPMTATMAEPGELVLDTAPSQSELYSADVVLTVVDPTTSDGDPEFPAWLLTKYRSAFEDGTLMRMMSQPAKPYSSEKLAIYHGRRFRNAIAKASTDTQHSNLQRGQRWQFPRNFV